MSKITIYPYRLGNCWVFDDARTGLKEEAFVLGSSEMMTRLVEAKGISQAEKGFALTFSDEPFEGHDAELTWLRSDDSHSLTNYLERSLCSNRSRSTSARTCVPAPICAMP